MYKIESLTDTERALYDRAIHNPTSLSLDELQSFKDILKRLNSELLAEIPPHVLDKIAEFLEGESQGCSSIESYYAGVLSGLKFCLYILNTYLKPEFVEPVESGCGAMLAYIRDKTSSLERYEKMRLEKLLSMDYKREDSNG